MAAYARHPVAQRRSSPNAMLAIIAAHVAAIAALMSAKMDLPRAITDPPTIIDFIQQDDPPPPVDLRPAEPTQRPTSVIDQPRPLVPAPPTDSEIVDSRPAPVPDFREIVGPSLEPPRAVQPVVPVKVAARLLTPATDLKPDYPRSKLASGEEAVLRLKLTIDERGRVIAAEPVGPADPAFLEAARRHLLARWRYRRATEDGRAVASWTLITLRFELER
jgi:periplasmic protein TonB